MRKGEIQMNMKTELKDVIHLYWGAEARISFEDEPEYYITTVDGAMLKRIDDYPEDTHVSLVLRRLSSMTEEEAVEIAKIMYGEPDSVRWRMEDKGTFFNVYRKHYSQSFTIDKASGDIDRYSNDGHQLENETTCNHHFITGYMLSKGFDLFNLIESGQAIDAETLKDSYKRTTK